VIVGPPGRRFLVRRASAGQTGVRPPDFRSLTGPGEPGRWTSRQNRTVIVASTSGEQAMSEWNATTYEGKPTILRVVREQAERMFAMAEQPDA